MSLREEIKLFEEKKAEKCTPKEREFLDAIQECYSISSNVTPFGEQEIPLKLEIFAHEFAHVRDAQQMFPWKYTEREMGEMLFDVFHHGRTDEYHYGVRMNPNKYDRRRPKDDGDDE